jgi:nucleotide-binding universal stress UspA family protein
MKEKTKLRPMNILFADDGSQHALAAIELIGELPLPPESCVTALAVLSPREASNHHVLENVLKQTKTKLEEKQIPVQTELLLGYPAEVISEYADRHKPDLIVLGAKGLRATLGILLGGVAQQVIEYADWPVLVVRAPYPGLQKILFVTDGSECSQEALEYFSNFPIPKKAKILAMHVLPPAPSPEMITQTWPLGPEMPYPIPAQTQAETQVWLGEEEQIGKDLLNRTLQTLKARGIKANSVLARGDAATEIIEYVKENSIDLIIAGSRGLSQMRSWLLGSVSRKLVHYAGCSVLVVKRNCIPEE